MWVILAPDLLREVCDNVNSSPPLCVLGFPALLLNISQLTCCRQMSFQCLIPEDPRPRQHISLLQHFKLYPLEIEQLYYLSAQTSQSKSCCFAAPDFLQHTVGSFFYYCLLTALSPEAFWSSGTWPSAHLMEGFLGGLPSGWVELETCCSPTASS